MSILLMSQIKSIQGSYYHLAKRLLGIEYVKRVEEDEDEAADGLWENASPGEVHERIRHHLTKKKFAQAVHLFSQALAEFPVFKKLEALSKEFKEQTNADGEAGLASNSIPCEILFVGRKISG